MYGGVKRGVLGVQTLAYRSEDVFSNDLYIAINRLEMLKTIQGNGKNLSLLGEHFDSGGL